MAVNVTQKDATLHQVIEWCKQQKAAIAEYIGSSWFIDPRTFVCLSSKADAYGDIMLRCQKMLGYDGDMPTEVPNQSEDAKGQDNEQ